MVSVSLSYFNGSECFFYRQADIEGLVAHQLRSSPALVQMLFGLIVTVQGSRSKEPLSNQGSGNYFDELEDELSGHFPPLGGIITADIFQVMMNPSLLRTDVKSPNKLKASAP
jgi:hypothetical protein